MKTIIGTVQALDGKYFAKDADGSIVALKIGDAITEDMVVFGDTSNNANAMIQITKLNFDDSIVLRGNDEQLFDSSLFDTDTITDPIASESLSEALDKTVLAETTDENAQNAEETAAGEEQAPGGQSLDDVFAARDGGSVDISTDVNSGITAVSSTGIADENTIFPVITDVNNAATLTITSTNNFTEDAAANAVGSTVATFTTNDVEGDTVTVTLSDTTNYALSGNTVVLTQAGLDLVNAGTDLPVFTLTPNDGTVDGTPVSVDPLVVDANDAATITIDDASVVTFTEDAANVVAGAKVADYTAADQDGTTPTVTVSNTGATQYYAIVNDAVVLTQAGADLVNTGADLPTFTVSATDGIQTTPATDSATPGLTVDANDAPVAVDDSITAIQNTLFTSTVDLDFNDTDLDGDTLSVTAGTFTTVNGGTLVLAADGSYTYTSATNFNGTDSVDYIVTDGVATDTGTLNITVDPLYTVTPVSTSIAEGGLITGFFSADLTPNYAQWTIDLSNTDTTSVALDLDNGSIDGTFWDMLESTEWGDFRGLEYKDVNGDWQDIDASFLNPTNGTVSVASTDTELVIRTRITPDLFKEADEIFHLNVTIDGITNSSEVTIENDDFNRAPVANDDIYSVGEDSVVALNLLSNDSDPDTNLIYTDSIAIKSINGTVLTGNVQTIDIDTKGTVEIDAAGTMTFNPALNYYGSVAFDYVITDGVLEDTASVSITVNAAPVANVDSVTVDEDNVVVIDVISNDTDVDGTMDPTTVVITTQPINGVVSVDATTGEVTYTPNTNYNGVDSFAYTVEDNEGLVSNPATVDLTINPIADSLLPDGNFGVTIDPNPIVFGLDPSDTGYDGFDTYTFADGTVMSSDGGALFSSTGQGIGIGTNGDFRIADDDIMTFNFPTPVLNLDMGFKNASDGLVVTSQEVSFDTTTTSISGSINTDDTSADFTKLETVMTIRFTDGSTTTVPNTANDNAWDFSLVGIDNGLISDISIDWTINDGLFSNNAAPSFSITNSTGLDVIEFSPIPNTDGFTLDYFVANIDSGISTSTYTIEVSIDLGNLTSDWMSKVTLTDIPSDAILSGTGVTQNLDGTWDIDISKYDPVTGLIGDIFMTTAASVTGFRPTLITETTDGNSVSETIVGGTIEQVGVTLDATDGNDYIDGAESYTQLNSGSGDDILVYDATDTLIDGGAGSDTLILTGDLNLNFSDINIANIQNIQNIDTISLETGIQNISISLQDVLDMTDNNTLTITDTALDTLTITEDGSQNVTITNNGWSEADTNDTTYTDGKIYQNTAGDSITLTVDESTYTIV